MSEYINYKNKYPTLIEYKQGQELFNNKLQDYLTMLDEFKNLVLEEYKKAQWIHIDGSLVKVIAQGNNIYGFNENGNVYKCNKPCQDSSWVQTDGIIKDIAGDQDNIYGLGENNNVWIKPEDNSANWSKIGSKMKFDKITTNNSTMIWGLKNTINVEIRLIIKVPDEENAESSQLNEISLFYGDKEITSRASLNGTSFDRNSSTTKSVFVSTKYDYSDGLRLYVGNDLLKIQNIQVQMKDDNGDFKSVYSNDLNVSLKNQEYKITFNKTNIGHLLYQCSKPCSSENWIPVDVPGNLNNVSSDDSYIYATNNDNEILRCLGNCNSGNWETDKIGRAKNIDGSSTKKLRVIGTDNSIWERNKNVWNAPWTSLNFNSKNTTMSNANTNTVEDVFLENEEMEGRLWSISSNNNIYSRLRPNFNEWRSVNNRNATTGIGETNESTQDWDYIGEYLTYDDCKLASLQKETAYNKITYFKNNYNNDNLKKSCWGNKIGGKFTNVDEEGVITGYPPFGLTKLGGPKGYVLLNKMKVMNAELIGMTEYLQSITIPINTNKIDFLKQKTSSSESLKNTLKNLNMDRKNIKLYEKQVKNLNAKNENSNLIFNQQSSFFIGTSIIAIIIVIITLNLLKKKK
jgi:hypothetical protein